MDQATTTPFAHHGRTGPVIRLAVVNGLLNLVTLSVWRFWGNTRVRRQLWSHTTLWGDPLEYTGTGKELFLGFLVVFVLVLLPLLVAGLGLNALLQSGEPRAILGVFALQALVLFLAAAGLYRARRYRLSRTLWRGIRGGQQGSAAVYGAMVLAAAFLGVVTLGWAWPWAEMWLQRYKMAHTTFGDQRFTCTASSRATYGSFALIWLGGLALMALGGLLIYALVTEAQGDLEQATPLMQMGPLLLNLLALPLIVLPYARYRATVHRTVANGTGFAGARFSMTFGLWRFVRLAIGNWLLTVATFGLLAPLAALRTFRFATTHLAVAGEPDFTAIAQGAAAAGTTGEGLAAAFDGAGAL